MVEYRGKKFPGYNKPVKSDRPEKKKMVLAKKGDEVKLVHFGDSSMQDYTQHGDAARRKSYLARSAGIKNKKGQMTKNDKFSANHRSRKALR